MAKKILKKKKFSLKKTSSKKVKVTKKKVARKKVAKKMTITKQIRIGDEVADFQVASTSGSDFRLSEQKGKKLVLYFYPKDSTPGCTLEGHEFTKLLPEFKKLNADVYGISRDSIKSHLNFKTKQCYTLDLLSDEDETMCKIFDVIKEKNMYGKMVLGIERSTFVINEQGRLILEWRKVKAEGHAELVLSKLREKA